MLKIKKISICLLCVCFCLFSKNISFASNTNTTDDLRELMGMKRLQDKGLEKEILRLLSSTYKEEQWNELVVELKDRIDFEYNEFVEKEEQYIAVKDKLSRSFGNNEDINLILELYVEYDTMNSLRSEHVYKDSYSLEILDTSDIKAKLKYIESIVFSTEDNSTIGAVGKDMDTFSRDSLLLTSVFGESRNVITGELEKNKGIIIAIPKEMPIYSQFHGKVTKVTNSVVEITTGNSLVLTYKNIKSQVKLNEKVKQYDELGTTKDNVMEFYVNLNTIYIDPLFLYGSRSQKWFEHWLNSYPGSSTNKFDYSQLLDEIPKIVIENNEVSGGTYIDENNQVDSIKFQGENYYDDTPDYIEIEKTIPVIIDEVVE